MGVESTECGGQGVQGWGWEPQCGVEGLRQAALLMGKMRTLFPPDYVVLSALSTCIPSTWHSGDTKSVPWNIFTFGRVAGEDFCRRKNGGKHRSWCCPQSQLLGPIFLPTVPVAGRRVSTYY